MKKYDIFISHAWNYDEHYCMVEDWLDESQSEYLLLWENSSVPLLDTAFNPNSSIGQKKLQEKLDHQISRSSVVLILSGLYTAYPNWIEYETLKAVNYEKYIIGVKPWGHENIPQVVLEYADVMVNWDKSSIIKAILESKNHSMIRHAYKY